MRFWINLISARKGEPPEKRGEKKPKPKYLRGYKIVEWCFVYREAVETFLVAPWLKVGINRGFNSTGCRKIPFFFPQTWLKPAQVAGSNFRGGGGRGREKNLPASFSLLFFRIWVSLLFMTEWKYSLKSLKLKRAKNDSGAHDVTPVMDKTSWHKIIKGDILLHTCVSLCISIGTCM